MSSSTRQDGSLTSLAGHHSRLIGFSIVVSYQLAIEEVLEIVREQARTMQNFITGRSRVETVDGVRTISIPLSMLRGTPANIHGTGTLLTGLDFAKPLHEDDEESATDLESPIKPK